MAAGDRILSLDGGGIRGLIMLEILDAIEKEAGTPIKDLFDWIGGTSTGGIVALGIATEQLIWEVAPSTSAAQTFFHPYKQYFDGGVLSNNPTLDVLTKIQEFNTGPAPQQKAPSGRGLNVVVFLGCGHSESKPVSVPDLYIPKIKERCCFLKTKKVLKDCQQFIKDVTERVTEANGPSTDRARAWCGMMDVPFYRLSPLLSDNVPMDCVDKQMIDKMVDETKAYIEENKQKIKEVAELLTKKHIAILYVKKSVTIVKTSHEAV